jgi:CHRD domain
MFTFAKLTVSTAIVIAVAVIATPVSTFAQQQMNFAANLSGKDMAPAVNTPATGKAEFHVNTDGSLCYQITVNNINGVLGAHITTKNGTELADLINSYAVVSSPDPLNPIQAYPTGPVNGLLASGDIRTGIGGQSGPIPTHGLPVTEINNMIKNKTAYVTIRTLGHQTGEIKGQILPTNSDVRCLTTHRFAPPTTTPNPKNALY